MVGPFVGHWRLRAIRDRIGAALNLGSFKAAWVELNLRGDLIGEWTYTSSRGEGVMPSAFASNGLLYGERWIENKPVGISVFDKSTSTWKPVTSLPHGHLLGSDGLRLVYQRGDQLQWVQGLNAQIENSSMTRP